MNMSRLPPFEAQLSLGGGGGGGGGTFIVWRGRRNLMGCGSRFLATISGVVVKTRKGLRREILGFVLAFTCVFCPGTRLYTHAWGAKAVFWRGAISEMSSSDTGPVSFLFAHYPRWGGTFLAWEGSSSDFWEAQPQNAPVAPSRLML